MPEPTFEWVARVRLQPNPWNPNSMPNDMYVKAIESIHEFGFVDPITCRTEWVRDQLVYEIIDGEHRWRASEGHGRCVRAKKGGGWERHVGLDVLPITNLGVLTDEIAQQLTIVLNETRGTYDPKKMGELLVDLVAVKPLPELLAVLPFDKPKFEELARLPSVDWGAVAAAPRRSAPEGERWVERVYRLPAEAAERLDDAIKTARQESDITNDWQALQRLADDFLGP